MAVTKGEREQGSSLPSRLRRSLRRLGGGIGSVRLFTIGFGKADWREGSREARRIVDPSTMGVSAPFQGAGPFSSRRSREEGLVSFLLPMSTGKRGLAKRDESLILQRWPSLSSKREEESSRLDVVNRRSRLFLIGFAETEGVGFSPSVKKPKVQALPKLKV